VFKYQAKMTKDIEKNRKKINKIDQKIQKYLEKREKLVRKIGEIKAKNKVKIENKSREKEILDKIESKYVKKIYKSIIEISKELQR